MPRICVERLTGQLAEAQAAAAQLVVAQLVVALEGLLALVPVEQAEAVWLVAAQTEAGR